MSRAALPVTSGPLERLRRWAEEVNAVYVEGGAGDGLSVPDPDDILELVEEIEIGRRRNRTMEAEIERLRDQWLKQEVRWPK